MARRNDNIRDTTVRYARLNCEGYEFGHMRCEQGKTPVYVKEGSRKTMEAALLANQMALEGQPCFGKY